MLNIKEIRSRIFSINKNDYPGNKLVASVAILGNSEYFGHNTRKSHPEMIRQFRNGSCGSCSHAEVSALNKVPRQCRHAVKLYVMRFLKNGTLSCAKPCQMCQGFLLRNGVDFKNVFYTNWEGDWERLSNEL